MCWSDSSDAADEYYEEQRAKEEARQAKIDEGLGMVRGLFTEESRAPIYDDAYENALALYMDDLNDQYGRTLAQLKVANARSGQSGGSLGATRFAELQNQKNKGVARAQQLAQQIKDGLFSSDQRTKGSLIQQIYGGIGATDAMDIALSALKSNQHNILRDARSEGLGNVFSDFGDAYLTSKKSQGYNTGKDQYSTYFNDNTSSGGAQQVS